MDYYLLQADEVIKNVISLKSFTRECGSVEMITLKKDTVRERITIENNM